MAWPTVGLSQTLRPCVMILDKNGREEEGVGGAGTVCFFSVCCSPLNWNGTGISRADRANLWSFVFRVAGRPVFIMRDLRPASKKKTNRNNNKKIKKNISFCGCFLFVLNSARSSTAAQHSSQ